MPKYPLICRQLPTAIWKIKHGHKLITVPLTQRWNRIHLPGKWPGFNDLLDQ